MIYFEMLFEQLRRGEKLGAAVGRAAERVKFFDVGQKLVVGLENRQRSAGRGLALEPVLGAEGPLLGVKPRVGLQVEARVDHLVAQAAGKRLGQLRLRSLNCSNRFEDFRL